MLFLDLCYIFSVANILIDIRVISIAGLANVVKQLIVLKLLLVLTLSLLVLLLLLLWLLLLMLLFRFSHLI